MTMHSYDEQDKIQLRPWKCISSKALAKKWNSRLKMRRLKMWKMTGEKCMSALCMQPALVDMRAISNFDTENRSNPFLAAMKMIRLQKRCQIVK